jgi:hypothetical protein
MSARKSHRRQHVPGLHRGRGVDLHHRRSFDESCDDNSHLFLKISRGEEEEEETKRSDLLGLVWLNPREREARYSNMP